MCNQVTILTMKYLSNRTDTIVDVVIIVDARRENPSLSTDHDRPQIAPGSERVQRVRDLLEHGDVQDVERRSREDQARDWRLDGQADRLVAIGLGLLLRHPRLLPRPAEV